MYMLFDYHHRRNKNTMVIRMQNKNAFSCLIVQINKNQAKDNNWNIYTMDRICENINKSYI